MFEYAIKVLKHEARRLLDKDEKLFTIKELSEFNMQIDEIYQAIEVLKKAETKVPYNTIELSIKNSPNKKD